MNKSNSILGLIMNKELKYFRNFGIVANSFTLLTAIFIAGLLVLTRPPGDSAVGVTTFAAIYLMMPAILAIACYVLMQKLRLVALLFIWLIAVYYLLIAFLGTMTIGLYLQPATILPFVGAVGATAQSREYRSRLAGILGAVFGIMLAVGPAIDSLKSKNLPIFLFSLGNYRNLIQPFAKAFVLLNLLALIGYIIYRQNKNLSLIFIWLSGITYPLLVIFLLISLGLNIEGALRTKALSYLVVFIPLLPVTLSLMGATGITREVRNSL